MPQPAVCIEICRSVTERLDVRRIGRAAQIRMPNRSLVCSMGNMQPVRPI
jgi:hypothetical protein